MIIKSIHISHKTESFFTEFDSNTNIIFNSENSQGKTTLIRFIIYGLGYNIPITYPIESSKYTTKLVINILNNECTIIRSNKIIQIKKAKEYKVFPLSNGNNNALEYLFDIDNINLLKNLLGTFYIDQDKGWTLFNKGLVIGSIQYDINQLIYALSDLDTKIFDKKSCSNKQLNSNKQLKSLYSEQEKLDYYSTDIKESDIRIKEIQSEITLLDSDLKKHKKIIQSYEKIKKQNKEMWDYIDSLQLTIKHNGELIKITKENILGLQDTNQITERQIDKETTIIKYYTKKIEEMQSKLDELIRNNEYTEDLYELGVKKCIQIDKDQIDSNIHILKQYCTSIDNQINTLVDKSKFLTRINEKLLEYCNTLEISDYLDKDKLIRSTLFKNRSGTNGQLLVLAYRLSVLNVVSDYLNIQLPIIIDTIDRETSEKNIEKILQFLNEKMSGHQIILSTITNLNFFGKIIHVSKPLLKKDPKIYKSILEY